MTEIQSSQGARVQQPWNKITSWRSAVKETYVYNQEKEVFAKLPHKRSRECVYQLLEIVHFPIQEIEGLIEKRGNMVALVKQDEQQKI